MSDEQIEAIDRLSELSLVQPDEIRLLALTDELECHWPDWSASSRDGGVPCACGFLVPLPTWRAFWMHVAQQIVTTCENRSTE